MMLFPIFVLFCVALNSRFASSATLDADPYRVLGLHRDASHEEIRAAYKKCCLKYHPDKHVGKPGKERRRCEELFKQIQSANSLIGDPESRRLYDSRSFFSTRSSGTYGSRTSTSKQQPFRDETVDAFFRAYAGSRRRGTGGTDFFGRPTPGFRFSFDDNYFSPYQAAGSLKSVYVQKVQIPLKVLFKGREKMSLEIHDSPWKRHCAAFRGGIAYILLCQSLIYASPLFRLSFRLSLVVAAWVYHLNIPKPNTLQYTVNIRPGLKSGSKIVFRDAEQGLDIVFVVEEERHHRFVRVGNDLHTTMELSTSEATGGGNFEVQPLDPLEDPPIRVTLRPKQIKTTGDVVVCEGKGWPIGKTGKRGNVVVHFRIASGRRVRKRKRRRKKDFP